MAERANDDESMMTRRGPRWGRIAGLFALGILLLIVVAIILVWIERRPIATRYLQGEFERRGVSASYHLDRVGLRTQEVHDLVIGDPARPDLVARHAIVQMRLKWNGSFEVYRVYARGVRLRGRLVNGKVSWGQLDKLLPPPSDKPFQLPNFSLDVADSSIALATPFGPVGIAVHGNGMLSGGFKGRVALVSPGLDLGKCSATALRVHAAVAVVARRPRIDGPVTLDRLSCPASRLEVVSPRFDAKASFNESFTKVDGSGRMASQRMIAGENGLAAFIGDISYKGSLVAVDGRVRLAARNSRLGAIVADRTRLDAAYELGIGDGTFAMLGKFAADSAALPPSMLAGVTQPLAAAAKTPIGPVANSIGNAVIRTSRNFDASGNIRVVNFPGGGAARVTSAAVTGPSGARARISGGSGVTYYWPSGALRIDANIETAGGGLPDAQITLRQPSVDASMSGVANIAPYSVNGTRLALTPIRFGPAPGGATAVSTIAQLDGPFPDGRVRALRLPITGRIGQGGSFGFGTSCLVASFDYLRTGALQLGKTRLPICPIGPAMILKRGRGPVSASARFKGPVLNGRLGSSPFHLAALGGRIVGKEFSLDDLGLRLGNPSSPVVFDANRLTGTFVGAGIRGKFSGAKATIGNVPLLLSEAAGTWQVYKGDLSVDSALTLSDRAEDPRFYPLRSDNTHFTLAGDFVRATGSLRHPASGSLVTNVDIEHQLSSGAGHADLAVPGLEFGPNLQPEEITRLTEGVIALVNGTLSGRGRINWNASGEVTSNGDLTTANLDFAAPFGPVEGLSGTIHFNDLLGLNSPPGQVIRVRSVNPGILVENGEIRYQLLPNQLVKIERGEWPFMGGRLILQETVLNFGKPTAKRLTFEVVGFDAKRFVDSLGFSGLEITGTFNGVLPMIFDENGGRIVGGRLDSLPPGGRFQYTGTKPEAGLMAGVVFDLLRDLRYRSMVVRLDGDLAGEFATRITIDEVALGTGGGLAGKLIRSAFSKVPLKFNLNVNGPFRSLIQMAKALKDPRQAIAPVMPFPIDSPSLDVTVQADRKEEEQTTTTPTADVDISTTPPSASEK